MNISMEKNVCRGTSIEHDTTIHFTLSHVQISKIRKFSRKSISFKQITYFITIDHAQSTFYGKISAKNDDFFKNSINFTEHSPK